ncbi:MAG: DUF922 domain-containing protein [Arenimonas sp.]|nr:DUF922 domain-containing protein [Rhizobium sp.]MBW8447430.1 DUF922 domain-containing protein [Arenimonas sp.]
MKTARRIGVLTAATGLWLALGGMTQAETIVRKSVSYFQIGGTTAEDLDRELERRGPVTRASGSRHPGATQIKFGGELDYVQSAGRCRIGNVDVTLDTRIILPQWKNRKRAKGDLALIWDALSSDIKRHEERHAEIARQYARQLEKTLKKLRPQRNCDAMQAKVAEATDRVIAAHDAAQMNFDRVEAVNFENRMMRILDYRAGQNSPKN